jgi:hypothetical protein
VAEYPLWGFDNYRLGPYLFRQLRHGKPLLNGRLDGTVSADLSAAASTLDAPEARKALTIAGVQTVVVHPTSPAPRDSGFRLESRLSDGTSIYSVEPVPHAAIASPRGGYAVEAGPDGSPFQWLGPDASLSAVATRAQPVTLTFDTVSIGVPRSVRFGADRREVSTAPTRVRLCVQTKPGGSAAVPIAMTPGPQRLPGGDPRVAGVGVFNLRAATGCGN